MFLRGNAQMLILIRYDNKLSHGSHAMCGGGRAILTNVLIQPVQETCLAERRVAGTWS